MPICPAFVVIGICYLALALPANAQENAYAINAIFAGQHLHDSAVLVQRQTASLSSQQRFEKLTHWILPSASHPDVRVSVGFDRPDGSSEAILVSPVLEWMDAAKALNRSGELRQMVDAMRTDSLSDQTSLQSLRLVLAMRQGNTKQVEELAKQFLASLMRDPRTIEQHRDATLLCLHVAKSSPETARMLIEPGQQLIKHYETLNFREAWHQHLKSTVAQITEIVHAEDYNSEILPDHHPQWQAVALSRSLEHGLGYPKAQWRFSDVGARNLSSHGQEFVFFAVPLEGDYDIETDVTGFSWLDSHMMTAGTWIAPIYDHKSYGFGNARGEHGRGPIEPALSETFAQATIRYRTRVRQSADGSIVTTFFNGRPVHQENRGRILDPWIAIRSSPVHDGGADDLRITGGKVPDVISLSDVPQLPGWFEHFGDPFAHSLQQWKQVSVINAGLGNPTKEIIGKKNPSLREGCFSENALRYFRPMLENATIAYEFFYSPGDTEVHPMLGRECFLINESGVQIHSLTDDRYDRTSARPDAVAQPTNSMKPKLNAHEWNHVALRLIDNTVSIDVNQTNVLTHTLKSSSEKHFGLFHYNDQTSARVRNIRWKGDWPKVLPSLEAQSLAVLPRQLQSSKLDESGMELTLQVNQDALNNNQLSKYSGDPIRHFQASEDGIVVQRPSDGGYCEARISPNISIEGDFDVTVKFDSLAARSIKGPLAGVSLEVIGNDAIEHQAAIRLKCEENGEQAAQCALAKIIDGDRRTDYFGGQIIDANAGRFRLSRRDSKIFYQFADNDSDQFRIVATRDFTPTKLDPGGIRFGVQVMGDTSFVQSRWTDFHVRAEKLSGMALDDSTETLSKLNQQRETLPDVVVMDLTKQAPSNADCYLWGSITPWSKDDGGLLATHVGTDDWNSSGIGFLKQIEGDFDIEIEFDSLEMGTPKPNHDTRLYLQLELADDGQNQVNSMVGQLDDDTMATLAQTRIADRHGKRVYRNVMGSDGASTKRLRLIRDGNVIYCLAGTDDPETDTITTQTIVSDAPLRRGALRAMLHTGGAGRTSSVRLKSMIVRAQKIQFLNRGVVRPVVPADQPAQPKPILQSIFDLF
ncbi:MAG: DUF1583 domain-containing protein [Pirellulaceae bacterium]